MRMRITMFVVGLSAGFVPALVLPGDVEACACCARSDEWMRQTGASEFERGEILRLRLSQGLLVAGVGERDPLFLNGPVRVEVSTPDPSVWEFVIETGETKSRSVLRFLPTDAWEFFQTYTGPWPGKMESEVQLYKEVVLPGVVDVSGALVEQYSLPMFSAKLIFKGQGNRCFSGEDFTQWMLRFVIPRGDGDITFVGSGTIAPAKK